MRFVVSSVLCYPFERSLPSSCYPVHFCYIIGWFNFSLYNACCHSDGKCQLAWQSGTDFLFPNFRSKKTKIRPLDLRKVAKAVNTLPSMHGLYIYKCFIKSLLLYVGWVPVAKYLKSNHDKSKSDESLCFVLSYKNMFGKCLKPTIFRDKVAFLSKASEQSC